MEVAGTNIPETDQQLVLNGAGLRKRAFFQVYAIGLYLMEKKAAAADAVGAAGPKRVAIHMLRIWLGENPVQSDLKKALLGEKQ